MQTKKVNFFLYIFFFLALNLFAQNSVYEKNYTAISILEQQKNSLPPNLSSKEKIDFWLKYSEIYFHNKDYQRAIQSIYYANLEIDKSTKNEQKISIYHHYARLYIVLRLLRDAKKNLELALPLIMSSNDSNYKSIELAKNKNFSGIIETQSGNNHNALKSFYEAEKIISPLNTIEAIETKSFIYRNLGYAHMSFRDNQLAKENFTKSVFYANTIKDHELSAYALRGLGSFYLTNNKNSLALQNLLNAKQFADKTNNYNLKIAISEKLVITYLRLNDWNKYIETENNLSYYKQKTKQNTQKAIQQSLYLQDLSLMKPYQEKVSFRYGILAIFGIAVIVVLSLIIYNHYKIIKISNSKSTP